MEEGWKGKRKEGRRGGWKEEGTFELESLVISCW
jgi:hypothetical protein